MSRSIVIADADYSFSVLPKWQRLAHGFPYDNLQALYLLQDTTVGAVPTVVTDSSGHGNDGTIMAGSSVQQALTGYTTPGPGDGFVIVSPVAWGGPFTVIEVVRCSSAYPLANRFPTYHLTSLAVNGGNVGGSENPNAGVAINASLASGAATTPMSLGMYNSALWTSPHQTRQILSLAGVDKNAWVAIARSFDPATSKFILRAAGQSIEVVDTTAATRENTAGGTHCFSMLHFNTVSVSGDCVLGGVYTGLAGDEDYLETLLVAARAEGARRSITVV